MIHPGTKRNLRQILSFGLIWLVFGLLYSLLEKGLLGGLDAYPTTGNRYYFGSSVFYTSTGSFITGLFLGTLEVIWFRRRFEKRPLWLKIVFKGFIYLLLINVFLVLMTIALNAQIFKVSPFSPEVLESVRLFFVAFSFWSIVIYAAAILATSLFFAEIGQYLGIGVLYNFLLGKYHKPRQEDRVFMFLDMSSSTSIAEQLGHEHYFVLLKSYYEDMTPGILETSGEIYQYVGDEIVVSWPEKLGLYQNSCLGCFAKIGASIGRRSEYYRNAFGLVPAFKAGFHIGKVTVGEIGIIKKELIYTGDVLNTTARITALCGEYGTNALISGTLLDKLPGSAGYVPTRIGTLKLRGKKEAVELFKLDFNC